MLPRQDIVRGRVSAFCNGERKLQQLEAFAMVTYLLNILRLQGHIRNDNALSSKWPTGN